MLSVRCRLYRNSAWLVVVSSNRLVVSLTGSRNCCRMSGITGWLTVATTTSHHDTTAPRPQTKFYAIIVLYMSRRKIFISPLMSRIWNTGRFPEDIKQKFSFKLFSLGILMVSCILFSKYTYCMSPKFFCSTGVMWKFIDRNLKWKLTLI